MKLNKGKIGMSAHKSRGFHYVVALLLVFAFGASPVIAETVIEEVQVVDQSEGGPPEFLVIYGTGFGPISPTIGGDGTPVLHLGTQVDPLVIAEDQGACSITPTPPLDSTDTECVVAELPKEIPCGDYLLLLQGAVPAASCEEDGKPIELTFEYTGDYCEASTYPNGTEKHKCTDGQVAPGDFVDLI